MISNDLRPSGLPDCVIDMRDSSQDLSAGPKGLSYGQMIQELHQRKEALEGLLREANTVTVLRKGDNPCFTLGAVFLGGSLVSAIALNIMNLALLDVSRTAYIVFNVLFGTGTVGGGSLAGCGCLRSQKVVKAIAVRNAAVRVEIAKIENLVGQLEVFSVQKQVFNDLKAFAEEKDDARLKQACQEYRAAFG